MEKWIILIAQKPDEKLYHPPYSIEDVEDLAVTNEDGALLFFDSLNEASNYQDENAISGQCVQLPMY